MDFKNGKTYGNLGQSLWMHTCRHASQDLCFGQVKEII